MAEAKHNDATIATPIRGVLLAVAAAVLALSLAGDTRQASATNTEIFLSLSDTSPTPITGVTMGIGSEARTYYVWAKKVSHPDGAGGFEIAFSYHDAVASVTALTADSTWLGSTNRIPGCLAPVWAESAPYVRPIPNNTTGLWEGKIACTTTGPPPPFGPTGDGLLGSITIEPGTVVGSTTVDLAYGTIVVSTGHVEGSTVYPPEEIDATVFGLNVFVVKCADVTSASGDPDGTVAVIDIFGIVGRFGTEEGGPGWDPKYDLNDDLAVTVPDVFGGVAQFGTECGGP